MPQFFELCNGIDDDCDGRFDEFTSTQCDDGIPCTEDVCAYVATAGVHRCEHLAGASGGGGANFPVLPPAGPDAPRRGAFCAHALAQSCVQHTDGSIDCTPVDPITCELARCAPGNLVPDAIARDVLLTPATANTFLGPIAPGDRTTPSPAALDGNGCVYVERDQTYCIANSPLGNTPPQGGNSSTWPIPQNWQLCAGPRPICVPFAPGGDQSTGCIDYCSAMLTRGTTVLAGSGGGECSAVFSPPGPGDPTGAVSLVFTPSQQLQWTASTTFGASWPAPCTAGSTCALTLPPAPVVPTPDGRTPALWGGDNVSASDGAGNVVTVALYNGLAHVAAAISTDGGRSYVAAQTVDAARGCFNIAALPTSPNQVDQPTVTIDSGFFPPRVWFVWRHFDYPGASAGGCVRGGNLIVPGGGATPFISWFPWFARASHGIELLRELDDADEGAGQGGFHVIARRLASGTERVSVAYSRNAGSFESNCSRNHAQSWDMVSSDDGGISWPVDGLIEHVAPGIDSGGYQWCAVPDTLPLQVGRSFRDFDLVDDPVGGARWAVVAFRTRLEVFFTVDDFTWNLVHVIEHPEPEFIWQPNIALDSAGRVAVTYYTWQPPGVARWVTASSADWFGLNFSQLDGSWSPPQIISTSPTGGAPGFFPVGTHLTGGLNGTGGGDDYETMLAAPPGFLPRGATFMGAWVQGTQAIPFVAAAPFAVLP